MDKELREKLEKDEFHGKGGAYVVGEDGVRRRATDEDGNEIHPTKDHPEGNAPRDKDGKLLHNPASLALDNRARRRPRRGACRFKCAAEKKGGSK
jgi:hypothetical protein